MLGKIDNEVRVFLIFFSFFCLLSVSKVWGEDGEKAWKGKSIVSLEEKSGLNRINEPVMVPIDFGKTGVRDLEREIRVIGKDGTEIPFQAVGGVGKGGVYSSADIFFLANVSADQEKRYTIYYGNQPVLPPRNETPFSVQKGDNFATCSNGKITVGINDTNGFQHSIMINDGLLAYFSCGTYVLNDEKQPNWPALQTIEDIKVMSGDIITRFDVTGRVLGSYKATVRLEVCAEQPWYRLKVLSVEFIGQAPYKLWGVQPVLPHFDKTTVPNPKLEDAKGERILFNLEKCYLGIIPGGAGYVLIPAGIDTNYLRDTRALKIRFEKEGDVWNEEETRPWLYVGVTKTKEEMETLVRRIKEPLEVKILDDAETTEVGSKTSLSPYRVSVVDSITKVRKDVPWTGKPDNAVSISAAKGEFESFQIVINSLSKELQDVKVEISDLLNQKGTTKIDTGCIKHYKVGYIQTVAPDYDVDRVGWWPDPLLEVNGFNIKKEEVRPIWFTIKVPEDTLPGEYHGEIVIKPSNAAPSKIDLNLKVWSFSIPKPHKLKVLYQIFTDVLARQYGFSDSFVWTGDPVPPGFSQIYEKYCANLAEHGVSVWGFLEKPTFSIQPDKTITADFSKMDNVIESYLKRGWLNYFGLPYRLGGGGVGSGGEEFDYFTVKEKFYDVKSAKYENLEVMPIHNNQENKKRLADILGLYGEHLKKKGWENLCFWYVYDEPILPEEYALLNEGIGLAQGKVKTYTVLTQDRLVDKVDILVYNMLLHDIIKTDAKEKWWYITSSPQHPYPNIFIDYPGIDQRIIPWLLWRKGMNGFLYYSVNHWSANGIKIPWETDFDGKKMVVGYPNGTGVLLYPGKDGPINSIRWEIIRDSIEDYDYLYLLTDLTDKLREKIKGDSSLLGKYKGRLDKTEEILREVKTNIAIEMDDYTKDTGKIQNIRGRIGEQIEALNKALLP